MILVYHVALAGLTEVAVGAQKLVARSPLSNPHIDGCLGDRAAILSPVIIHMVNLQDTGV